MRFALFKEVPKRRHRKKRKLNTGGAARKGSEGPDGSDDESDGDDSGDEADAAQRMSSPPAPAAKKPAPAPARDPIWGDESQDANMQVDAQAPAGSSDDGKIGKER